MRYPTKFALLLAAGTALGGTSAMADCNGFYTGNNADNCTSTFIGAIPNGRFQAFQPNANGFQSTPFQDPTQLARERLVGLHRGVSLTGPRRPGARLPLRLTGCVLSSPSAPSTTWAVSRRTCPRRGDRC